MPIDNWLVEEKVYPIPKPDFRAIYIRLLEEMISTLKETSPYQSESGEVSHAPIYGIPTVVFSYLNTETGEDHALAQLICYRDRRDFLRGLAAYGDEDYIKELRLGPFLSKGEPKDTTQSDT